MSKFGDYEDKPFLAELYDLVPRHTDRRDLEFYVNLSRETGGKVLELGSGTGRVLIAIAGAGVDVVGLDLSPFMLAKCRENLAVQPQALQDRVRLVEASMTDFELGEEFTTIIIPFRPFQHLLSVSDQIACLRCTNRHLRPGGKLVFDLFQVNFSKIADPRNLEEKEDLAELELPDGRKMRRCSRFTATHRTQQYNEVEIIYYLTDSEGKTERLVQAFPFRYFFRYEVEHLLARTGFEVAALYGDFDSSPLRDESPEMIFVATKTGDSNDGEVLGQ